MLSRDLIPTPLDTRKRRSPPVMALVEPPRWRGLWIARKLTGFALRLAVEKGQRRLGARRTGVLVRELFETMGGLWVKLGQLLAMRRDIFPIDFCEELARLHDRATGFPGEIARGILEEDLQAPVESHFSEFDLTPVAAASIGQTHIARLHDGVKVAIKVQRPHIRAVFERDLVYMQRLFSLMDRLGVKRQFHWEELTWELSQ